MKERFSGLILLVLAFCFSAAGQEQERTVFEHTSDSLYSFYFDNQYYLIDKKCEFFAITRACSYNTVLKSFEGPFTDTDTQGNVILTGSYYKGKKQGTFKGFYPDGFLKWQGEFDADLPVKTWFYYYPDGRPMSILKSENGVVGITDAWDKRGKAVVKDGTGKYELEDPQFGFNEKGYEAIIYRGAVKEGLPDGNWKILYKYSGRNIETAAIENFQNGRFNTGFAFEEGNRAYTQSKIIYAPTAQFTNAERFIAKNCNVDEHFNFTLYLSDYLTKNCTFSSSSNTSGDKTITFSLNVDRNGQASGITLLEGFEDPFADKRMLQLLYSIGYWIPSQKDGKLINDTLTVKTDVLEENTGKIMFSNARISRKTGS